MGCLDIVSANSSTDDVSVLLNQGDGTFAPAVNYSLGHTPEQVVVGNLTNHGDRDVVTANSDGSVSVLLGKGDGTLQTAVTYMLGSTQGSVAVGNFRGGSVDDIALSQNGSNNILLLPNNGNGTFGTPTTLAGHDQTGAPDVGGTIRSSPPETRTRPALTRWSWWASPACASRRTAA